MDNMINNRKLKLNIAEGILMICLLIFIITVLTRNTSGNIPMSLIDQEMSSLNGVTDLIRKDDRAASSSFGFVPSDYIYYKSNDIMDVRELFIAKAADDDEMDRLTEAAAGRLAVQIDNFTGYGTNQLEKLEHAILMQKGDYYFYAVGDEADDWQSHFLRLAG